MKKTKLVFNLNFLNYFKLIKLSLLKPSFYAREIPPNCDLKNPLLFFLINIIISYFLQITFKLVTYQDSALFFFATSEIVILIPFFILGLILYTSILFFLAKILGGKGNFHQSLVGICFCSAPLIFIWIPGVSMVAFFLMLYSLATYFQLTHRYSILKAILNMVVPLIFLALAALILGVISFLSFFTLAKNSLY